MISLFVFKIVDLNFITNYVRFIFQLAEDTGLPKHQLVYLVGILEKKIDVDKGQAHHMFSRFLNLQIYDFVSQIFLCYVFLQWEKFSIEIKNANVTVNHNRKRHSASLNEQIRFRKKDRYIRRFRIGENML